MEIRPAVDSMSLKSAKVRLLLPAPVRPPERYHFDYALNDVEFFSSSRIHVAIILLFSIKILCPIRDENQLINLWLLKLRVLAQYGQGQF